MAVFNLNDVKLWVAGTDMSTDHNQASLQITADELDVTTFGQTYRQRIGGLRSVSLSGAGFYDSDGTDEPDDIWFPQLASANVITVSAQGGDEGEVAYTFRGLPFQYEWGGNVGDVTGFSFSTSGKTVAARGTILEDGQTTRTTTFDGSGYQLGSVSAAQKVYASLHVLSASGTTPTLDVTVESDDNGSFTSAATQVTFSQATGTGAQWATPVSGAISDDYWRVAATLGGTSPQFTFVVVVAIQ